MGVGGDGTPACSRVGPGSALITAQEAGGDPRVCVARPRSQAGLVNQTAALAGPGRLPLVSGPGGDPRLGCLRVPTPLPRRCHCSLTSRCGPAPRPPPSLPISGFRRPRPCSLQSPGRPRLPPRPDRGCAPLRSPQLAFVIPAPFLASPPTPRRTAKRGARSRHHTWNPKRAPGRILPSLCGEGSARVRARVCPTRAARALIMIWN